MADNNRIFIIEPDPFIGISTKVASYIPNYNATTDITKDQRKGLAKAAQFGLDKLGVEIEDIEVVSRPINGFAAKPDSHAFVQVIDNQGVVLKVFNRIGKKKSLAASGDLLDANERSSRPERSAAIIRSAAKTAGKFLGGAGGPAAEQTKGVSEPNSTAWTDWILSHVREERVEKTQIVETFGDDYLYAFGEKPRALSFQGILFNTVDFNWRAQFWENWNLFFRASKLIESSARMYIGYDDILVAGYPINAVADQTSQGENAVRFSFSFYLTDYYNLAAQSGFRATAASNIPSIAGGFRKGTAELKPTRSSLIELFNVAELVEDRTTSEFLASASKGLFAIAKGEANATAFLRAFLFRTAQNTFSRTLNASIQAAEDTGFGGLTGPLKRGEINAWFGFLATVLNTLDTTAWDGLAGFSPDGPVADLLRLGSTQRIIDSLAYNTTGLFTQGLGSARPGAIVATSIRPFQNVGGLGTVFR